MTGMILMATENWLTARVEALTRGLTYDVEVHDGEDLDALRKQAFAAHLEREGYERADDRVVANWLRHVRTPYESSLWEMDRRQGAVVSDEARQRAYDRVRRLTMAAIAQRFPELSDACEQVSMSNYVRGAGVSTRVFP